MLKTRCKFCKSKDAEIFRESYLLFKAICYDCRLDWVPDKEIYKKLGFKFSYCREIVLFNKGLKKRARDKGKPKIATTTKTKKNSGSGNLRKPKLKKRDQRIHSWSNMKVK